MTADRRHAAWATEANLHLLRTWWGEALSADEMASRLETTPRAITAMGARIGLPARGRPRAAWATERALGIFRAMWTAGDSTQKIGDRLGVSKNAIVSMRRRVGLPDRPSPIIRRDPPMPHEKASPRPIPCPAATLPPLIAAPKAIVPPRRVPPKITAPPVPESRYARHEPCCWVTAPAKGGRLPLYCDTKSMPGLPYCPEHAKAAYPAVKLRAARCDQVTGRKHSIDGGR